MHNIWYTHTIIYYVLTQNLMIDSSQTNKTKGVDLDKLYILLNHKAHKRVA